jgi:hypothetical protein
MIPGPGHNNGPTLEGGTAWRRHCWSKARADLLPRLPIEVLRNRVRRAAEIGLDYSTYATVRASTGRDIVAILFSTNALRLLRETQALEQARADKLRAIQGCERRVLAVSPVSAPAVMAAHADVLDAGFAAPPVLAGWAETARAMQAARAPGLPADAVLLIGDTALERDWSLAGKLAGYLTSERFFP